MLLVCYNLAVKKTMHENASNLSYENGFCMQFHFNANKSHFHNGFALKTRKCPITYYNSLADTQNNIMWELIVLILHVLNCL